MKRLRTTPLPAGVYLAGRIGAALFITAVTIAVLVSVGVVAYDFELVWIQVPAALTTLMAGAACSAALGMALAALVRPAAVQAAAFGTLLPRSFVSEIFLFGDPLPAVLSAVGWTFPLRHFAVALADTADPATTGAGLAWDHLGIITAWGLAGLAAARRWFAWDPAGETRRGRPHRSVPGGSVIPLDSSHEWVDDRSIR